MRLGPGEVEPHGYSRWRMRQFFIEMIWYEYPQIFERLRDKPMKVFLAAHLNQVPDLYLDDLWPCLNARSTEQLLKICKAMECMTNESITHVYRALEQWANDSRLTFTDMDWLLRSAFFILHAWSGSIEAPDDLAFPASISIRIQEFSEPESTAQKKPPRLLEWSPFDESEAEYKKRVAEHIEEIKKYYEVEKYKKPIEKSVYEPTEDEGRAMAEDNQEVFQRVQEKMRDSPLWKHLRWLAEFQIGGRSYAAIAREGSASGAKAVKDEVVKLADIIGLTLRKTEAGRPLGSKDKQPRHRVK